MTISKTQRIGAKESAEAKPERRYERLRYICCLNRSANIVFQSVKAIKKPIEIKKQSNGIVTKLSHFLAFRWLLMALQHLGKLC